MRAVVPILLLPLSLLSADPAWAQFRNGYRKTPPKAVGDATWPAEAAKVGMEGEASAVCEVGNRSQLTDCRVVSEHPAGAGFGEALLSLAPLYVAKPMGNRACGDYFHQIVISWSWSKVDRGAQWVAKPWAGQLSNFYPAEAEKAGQRGTAVIDCTVLASGTVSGCAAVYENPAGMGFGAAGVAMAATFQFKPAKSEKTPVSSRIVIPITFTPSAAPSWNCG